MGRARGPGFHFFVGALRFLLPRRSACGPHYSVEGPRCKLSGKPLVSSRLLELHLSSRLEVLSVNGNDTDAMRTVRKHTGSAKKRPGGGVALLAAWRSLPLPSDAARQASQPSSL